MKLAARAGWCEASRADKQFSLSAPALECRRGPHRRLCESRDEENLVLLEFNPETVAGKVVPVPDMCGYVTLDGHATIKIRLVRILFEQ